MNKVLFIGNLTHSPESKTTPNGVQVCSFTVAVNRKDKEAIFYRVTAWRGLAETCGKFLEKGKKVAVIGELDPRTYESKDGSTKVSLDVTASEIEFLSPRTEQTIPAGFTEVTDDELPFK